MNLSADVDVLGRVTVGMIQYHVDRPRYNQHNATSEFQCSLMLRLDCDHFDFVMCNLPDIVTHSLGDDRLQSAHYGH